MSHQKELNLLVASGYVISDTAFDPGLREEARIALAAVSYDGCALKHVASQLRSMANLGFSVVSLHFFALDLGFT